MNREGERLHFGIPEAVSALFILLMFLTPGVLFRVWLDYLLRKARIE